MDALTTDIPTGQAIRRTTDKLAIGLGWFSFGLGIVELVAPGRLARILGMQGKERLIRAYGVREIAAGIPTLAGDRRVGLISRVAGDALDIVTLAPALRPTNLKRQNVVLALAAVGAVTLLDMAATAGLFSAQRQAT